MDCLKISDDNKHLAEWLEELKVLRLQNHLGREEAFNAGRKQGYNNAIDDFVEAIDRADREEPLILDMYEIEEIAEQLKEGGE